MIVIGLGLTKEQLRAAGMAALRGTGLGFTLGILPEGAAMLASFASYNHAGALRIALPDVRWTPAVPPGEPD